MLDLMNGAQRLSNDVEDAVYNRKEVSTLSRFIAGGVAGTTACIACYPLDLVRTRLTTQLEGKETYR